MVGSLSHEENHVWLHPDGSLAALPLPQPHSWRLFVEITRQPHTQRQQSRMFESTLRGGLLQ